MAGRTVCSCGGVLFVGKQMCVNIGEHVQREGYGGVFPWCVAQRNAQRWMVRVYNTACNPNHGRIRTRIRGRLQASKLRYVTPQQLSHSVDRKRNEHGPAAAAPTATTA